MLNWVDSVNATDHSYLVKDAIFICLKHTSMGEKLPENHMKLMLPLDWHMCLFLYVVLFTYLNKNCLLTSDYSLGMLCVAGLNRKGTIIKKKT